MSASIVFEHLYLVLSALTIAILIGIPLGVLTYLYPVCRTVVLKIVDLIQTTPTLALLGIIMVFAGAGKPTVIIGLALYSLLPIVRNTQLGLSQVSPHLKEAARGIGMNRFYQLIHVEFPLAMPIIFSGLRIATVNAIGSAAFAAYVGGGGIGSTIYTGIRRMDMGLILSGTGVLMLMAIIFDLSMGFIEQRLSKYRSVQ